MQELNSLPRKIAGKLVVAGQDKYIRIAYQLKTKTLNYNKALQVTT